MTRHRRPEWKRPRVPCRPPATLIERVGIWLAYSGVLSTWTGYEGLYFGTWDYWVGLAGARGWSREQMFSHMRADAVEHQAALAEAEQRVGPEESSGHLESVRVGPDKELRAAASAIMPELAWWQRLLRYLGVTKYG